MKKKKKSYKITTTKNTHCNFIWIKNNNNNKLINNFKHLILRGTFWFKYIF